MKAVLLSAGEGTRLRPITLHTPKCLVPVHGRPLLAHWLDLLMPHVDRVLINTHYLPEPVRRFVAESPWADRIDVVHEHELLGTGGTLVANGAYLRGAPFLVAHADNLTWFDVPGFLDRHRRRPPEAHVTMMTFRTDAPRSCGIVDVAPDDIVTAYSEKPARPAGNLANAAVYLFEPDVLEFMFSLGRPLLELSVDIIPAYVRRMIAWENRWYHRDIGTPESLERAGREYPDFINALRHRTTSA